MLELHQVSKRYGRRTVLEPIDLALPTKWTCVLLGMSGCGKSTLIKLALGLVPPDSGTVRVGGVQLTAKNRLEVRRRIGYVSQHGGLFPHLTARDNVSLVARYLRWEPSRIAGRIAQLSELARLPSEALDRYPAQLSGGQQQRVGLMRALMLEPDLLLMDEPLGALDPITRSELQADLRAIFRTLQKTVLLVTHDLHEAAYFADEILLLREGRVVQRGSVQQLLHAPAEPFVTAFVSAQRSPLEGNSP